MKTQDYVIRAAQIKGLSLIKPTKKTPGILAYDFAKKDSRGLFPCVIDADSWETAKEQIDSYYQLQASQL